MNWRAALRPVRMERVAIVAATRSLDDVLRIVGRAGVVELSTPPDAPLPAVSKSAVVRGEVAALAGWTPAKVVSELAGQVAGGGGAVVPLARPRDQEAPSLLRSEGLRGSLAPLVSTYGTTPYADLDPTPLAVGAYVLMFGMMFGDVGHGLLLVVAAAALYRERPRRLPRLHRAWPFAAGAGLASMVFGLLYGEFFGPTGVVPVLWVRPLTDPIGLLAAALAGGALLLAVAYLLGVVNRWREGGWPATLYSPAGVAGAALFFGLGLTLLGWYAKLGWPAVLGGVLAVSGLLLAFTGFYTEAGGGASGIAQALVQLFDVVVRLGANVASFARLAAFGLTHAAIGAIVWSATTGLWAAVPVVAVAVFLLGNVLALAIEGLVAGVQALRLEYYELFSKVFQAEGRPFRPWHLPATPQEEAVPCPCG
ncbi:ATPase [Nonomuraea sp. MG754425]|uniref:V-type ATPase 116kDa subunit family protein n=1 Tax=Nonomuraea sp. MG754425 TaxID=2570319 RepID=UPI001F29DACD|nr:V-type ATPase 116kDa subunit family protein [Nonomuraea sp. MG754425]MCF6474614.1 ATPase [Nonomuraea sp. MG754425]